MNWSELYRKYNVPGPRYTSYPTVPYWENSPTEAQWIEAVQSALTEGLKLKAGAALYIHIPFCESLCTYCGCNTRITRNRTVGKTYVDVLLKEWQLYREKLGVEKIPLGELHLGGGTPTFLTPSELDTLMQGILAHSIKVQGAEFSVEVDPRVTSREHLEVLARHGVKRLSLGVQDFDPKVQDVVNRIQSEEQVQKVTQQGREQGYESVNYDLIYGLPFQTLQSIEQTMQAVKRLRPDRIAFYAYAHVPWIKPSQRRFTEADLPSGDEKRALYELGRKMLEEVGYREIGMDHFALETDSLYKASVSGELHRNFMGYTGRLVTPLIGLGVSAIGDAWSAFMQNEKLLETYQDRVLKGELPVLRGHVLNPEDMEIRRHILNLMTQFETRWTETSDFSELLNQSAFKLKELEADGLVELEMGRIHVTDLGKGFVRNICMALDARLARKAPKTQLFSQTV